MDFSKMSVAEWKAHAKEMNRLASLNDGELSDNAVVFHGNITVMDEAAPKPLTPRENYLASLALGKGFGVLTGEFRKENETAVLSGLAPEYVPERPDASPEN